MTVVKLFTVMHFGGVIMFLKQNNSPLCILANQSIIIVKLRACDALISL